MVHRGSVRLAMAEANFDATLNFPFGIATLDIEIVDAALFVMTKASKGEHVFTERHWLSCLESERMPGRRRPLSQLDRLSTVSLPFSMTQA